MSDLHFCLNQWWLKEASCVNEGVWSLWLRNAAFCLTRIILESNCCFEIFAAGHSLKEGKQSLDIRGQKCSPLSFSQRQSISLDFSELWICRPPTPKQKQRRSWRRKEEKVEEKSERRVRQKKGIQLHQPCPPQNGLPSFHQPYSWIEHEGNKMTVFYQTGGNCW